ncbi:MAG: Ca-activated chloride channel family protein [Lentimonas sp.]|jgi:Ca-activated chloride channel family protein
MIRRLIYCAWGITMLILAVCWFTDAGNIRRPDDLAYKLYSKGEYKEAAQTFTNSEWQAIALYRAGDFKAAANIFAGYDTPEGCFNHGNALVFQGNYTAAAQRYSRALELRPDWEATATNRDIALARAKLLEFKGGEGTGGKLGADDTIISNQPPSDSSNDQTEIVEDAAPLSDAELRAVWLRQVQTNPADFLKSKFSYQASQEAKQ